MELKNITDRIKTKQELLSGLENELLTRGDKPEVSITCLPELNKFIWGLPKGLTILAGRPSNYKTSLATAFALDFALQGIPTLFLSLEDTETGIMEKMFCNYASIPNRDLLCGAMKINVNYQALYKQFCDMFRNLPFFVTCGIGKNMREVNEYISKFESPAKVIILDYIQMTKMGERERENLSEYVREFRSLMLDIGARGIMCSQITRNTTKQNEGDFKPTLESLKGTGSLEENAELALLLFNKYFYTKDPMHMNDFEIIIAKNKRGMTGYHQCKVYPEFYQFKEKEAVIEEKQTEVPF